MKCMITLKCFVLRISAWLIHANSQMPRNKNKRQNVVVLGARLLVPLSKMFTSHISSIRPLVSFLRKSKCCQLTNDSNVIWWVDCSSSSCCCSSRRSSIFTIQFLTVSQTGSLHVLDTRWSCSSCAWGLDDVATCREICLSALQQRTYQALFILLVKRRAWRFKWATFGMLFSVCLQYRYSNHVIRRECGRNILSVLLSSRVI